MPQNSEINIQELINIDSSEDKSPALEANIEQNVENPNVEIHSNIYNIRQNSSVSYTSKSRAKVNEEICSTEKSGRIAKYKNIYNILKIGGYSQPDVDHVMYINNVTLLNKIRDNIQVLRALMKVGVQWQISEVIKIFSTGELHKMIIDKELFNIILSKSGTADEILSIYSQDMNVLKAIKSVLEVSSIRVSDLINKLEDTQAKENLGIVSALYANGFIQPNSININTMLNNEIVHNLILVYLEQIIDPEGHDLRALVTSIFHREKTQSPVTSLQILCITNIMQNTDAQICIY